MTAPARSAGFSLGGVAVVATLFLVFLSAYADRQVIGLLVPSLKRDLGMSDTQIGLLQGLAFAAVFVLAGLPIGRLVDHSNRRNIIAGGLAVWSVATIASGFASSFGQLFAARVLVGIGEACLAPAAVSFIADCFAPERRGRALGLVQLGGPLGSASALMAGGLILKAYADAAPPWLPGDGAAWRMVFVLMGLPGLVIALLVMLLREPVRQVRPEPGAQVDPIAALPALPSLLGAGRGALWGPFLGLFGLVSLVVYGVTSWAPTLLMRTYHMPPASAGATYGGIILICSVGGSAASGFVSDWLAKRRPGDGRIILPLALLPLQLAMWIVVLNASELHLLLALLGASSFCSTMIGASAYVALQDVVPNTLRGRAIAILVLVTNLLGLGVGPMAVALTTDHVLGDEAKLQTALALVAIAGTALALICAVAVVRRYRAVRFMMTGQGDAPGHVTNY